MKIAFVITGLAVGGAEAQLATLCQELKCDTQLSVKVFSISPINDLSDKFNGVVVEYFDLKKISGLFKLIISLNKYCPDIIHSHMIHSNIFSMFYGFFTKTVCFCTVHNTIESGRILSILLSLSYKICVPIVSHVSSHSIPSYKNKYNLNDVSWYKNPVNFNMYRSLDLVEVPAFLNDLFYCRNDNRRVWINVASLTEQKRQDRLIACFKLYLRNFPDDLLLIVGKGPNFKDLENMILTLQLKNNVFLLGARNDINHLLNFSNYFILTSDWEGLPVSIIEAMSVGLPVVSTDCGDVNLLVNDFTGSLTSKDPSDIVDTMLKLREFSDDKLDVISNNCIEKSKDFDVLLVKDQLLELYSSSLLGSQHSRTR